MTSRLDSSPSSACDPSMPWSGHKNRACALVTLTLCTQTSKQRQSTHQQARCEGAASWSAQARGASGDVRVQLSGALDQRQRAAAARLHTVHAPRLVQRALQQAPQRAQRVT